MIKHYWSLENCECGFQGFATEKQVKEYIAYKRDVEGKRFFDWIQCPSGSFIYHAFDKTIRDKDDYIDMLKSGCGHSINKKASQATRILFNNGSFCFYKSKEELDDIYDKVTAAYIAYELHGAA